ncbi:hypothetical protein GA0074695_2353 [Micromonospora viridifaciens]|uniref:Uncharacterized protein n=1 Tax=Micromonospora viridifaciens TaxID=1881 RepID=A0A1C4WEE1_MICVI|nr:hypothetical protein GA0074695_2353 [Micromonospora viridifaciens]
MAECLTDRAVLGVAEELLGAAELGAADGISGRVIGSSDASGGMVAVNSGSPPSGGAPDLHMNARAQSSTPTPRPPTAICQRCRLAGRGRADPSP